MSFESTFRTLHTSMNQMRKGHIGQTASEKWQDNYRHRAFPQRAVSYLSFMLREKFLTTDDTDQMELFRTCLNLSENLTPDHALCEIKLAFDPNVNVRGPRLDLSFQFSVFNPTARYGSGTKMGNHILEDRHKSMTGDDLASVVPMLMQVFCARPLVEKLDEVTFECLPDCVTHDQLQQWLQCNISVNSDKPWTLTLTPESIRYNDFKWELNCRDMVEILSKYEL